MRAFEVNAIDYLLKPYTAERFNATLEPWTHGEYVLILRNGTKVNSGRGCGERVRRLFA